ncbi:unnamed protein product, partial [Protopolystoma xenopodis]
LDISFGAPSNGVRGADREDDSGQIEKPPASFGSTMLTYSHALMAYFYQLLKGAFRLYTARLAQSKEPALIRHWQLEFGLAEVLDRVHLKFRKRQNWIPSCGNVDSFPTLLLHSTTPLIFASPPNAVSSDFALPDHILPRLPNPFGISFVSGSGYNMSSDISSIFQMLSAYPGPVRPNDFLISTAASTYHMDTVGCVVLARCGCSNFNK